MKSSTLTPLTTAAVPRITAVIPTYNRSALVIRAVESALSQTRCPDEIIVVDDGSTDDTLQRLQPYAADGVRVATQPNAGASIARNHGVRLASHDWVAFLDSDDLWVPEHLDRMSSAIAATRGTAAFYFADTRFVQAGTRTSFWGEAGFAPAAPFEVRADAREWVSLPLQPMLLQATVVSRASFLTLGGFWEPLRLRQDTHFFFLAGVGGTACAVSEAGAVMTDDDGGGRSTVRHSTDTISYWRFTELMYRDLLDRVPDLDEGTRSMLRQRLASGQWRLARRHLAEGNRRDFLRNVVKSLRTSPTEVPRCIARAPRRLLTG